MSYNNNKGINLVIDRHDGSNMPSVQPLSQESVPQLLIVFLFVILALYQLSAMYSTNARLRDGDCAGARREYRPVIWITTLFLLLGAVSFILYALGYSNNAKLYLGTFGTVIEAKRG